MASVVLNGVTYTDDSNGSTGMANGGHRARFVPCLANFVIEAETQLGLQHASRDAADASEAAALASEIAAAESAASALNSPGTFSTSTTSLALGTGTKSLTIQTGKALVIGQTVSIARSSDANYWMQGVITAHDPETGGLVVNVAAFRRSGTFSDWTVAVCGADVSWGRVDMPMSTRTSNTMLDAEAQGRFVNITSGSFAQTFDLCVNLGVSWWCYLRNSGSGEITISPSGTDTIDGRTGFVMYPGETRIIQCDGTSLLSFILSPFNKTFTASGTFIKPPGYSMFGALVWSGGNSGQKSGAVATASAGGGGGGCGLFNLPAPLFSNSETVMIGAGGAEATSVGVGDVGGVTKIGTSIAQAHPGNPGQGGHYTGGSIRYGAQSNSTYGAFGFEGAATNSSPAQMGSVYGGAAASYNGSVASGSSIYGGAGGGSVSASAVVQSPGTSVYGGNGGAASSASSGSPGAAPGGGGGATQTGAQSGAGGRGEVRIWGVI